MGRKRKSEEAIEEPELRRSSRQRKLKKDSDVDFDYDYHRVEDKYTNLEPSRPKRVSSHIAAPTSSSGSTYPPNFHYKSRQNSAPEPKTKLDIDNMDPKEIIDAHCKKLEARLQRVASNYEPMFGPEANSKCLTAPITDPDVEVVSNVVENLVNAIATTHN